MKCALSLGVEVIVPPGNFDHFKFAVEHVDEAIDNPLPDRERALLSAWLEQVIDRRFFGVECYAL